MIDKYQEIEKAIRKELACSAHNIDHVIRVYNLAMKIAEIEGNVDFHILRPAVLLHDIARIKEDNDPSGDTNHAILGAKMAYPILKDLEFDEEYIKMIQNCIVQHRYRSGNEPQTIEAKILFDADKVDALGAIGIARGFVWVGRNGAKIYNDIDLEQYIQENLGGKINGRIQDKTKHTIQIEYATKIRFVKDKLYTESAKEIARERTKFYKDFLDRLEREIKGEL